MKDLNSEEMENEELTTVQETLQIAALSAPKAPRHIMDLVLARLESHKAASSDQARRSYFSESCSEEVD